jgi:hypothetical protein
MEAADSGDVSSGSSRMSLRLLRSLLWLSLLLQSRQRAAAPGVKDDGMVDATIRAADTLILAAVAATVAIGQSAEIVVREAVSAAKAVTTANARTRAVGVMEAVIDIAVAATEIVTRTGVIARQSVALTKTRRAIAASAVTVDGTEIGMAIATAPMPRERMEIAGASPVGLTRVGVATLAGATPAARTRISPMTSAVPPMQIVPVSSAARMAIVLGNSAARRRTVPIVPSMLRPAPEQVTFAPRARREPPVASDMAAETAVASDRAAANAVSEVTASLAVAVGVVVEADVAAVAVREKTRALPTAA